MSALSKAQNYVSALFDAEQSMLALMEAAKEMGEPMAREAETIFDALLQRRKAIEGLITQKLDHDEKT